MLKKNSTEQSPGVVVRSQPLESQQNVPLKQMYLFSAIKSIFYQSQMIICRPESTELNRIFLQNHKIAATTRTKNSDRKFIVGHTDGDESDDRDIL